MHNIVGIIYTWVDIVGVIFIWLILLEWYIWVDIVGLIFIGFIVRLMFVGYLVGIIFIMWCYNNFVDLFADTFIDHNVGYYKYCLYC